MPLTKLTCPSCAASLEVPDHLETIHCMYCGSKVLLGQPGAVHDNQALQKFVELCRVAVAAGNHDEVIQYANRVLEIDPNNIRAWIDKAVATFWLTTGAKNRYDEAMGYLNKAEQIAPNDGQIQA